LARPYGVSAIYKLVVETLNPLSTAVSSVIPTFAIWGWVKIISGTLSWVRGTGTSAKELPADLRPSFAAT